MKDGSSTRAWVAGCGIALLCGTWVGAAGAVEERTAPEPLEAALVGVRNSIINASAKLTNDVVGISSDEGGPATPGRSCCSGNLKYVEEQVREAARILEDFDRCYEKAGNTDMVLLARVTRSDLATFARTLSGFADARSKREAQAALDAMSRTYNLLRDSAVGLATCGDVARPAARRPDAKPGTRK